MSEIKINKYNKSITIVDDGIGFLEFGVADEILDLISNLQKQLQQKENIIKEVREKINTLYNTFMYDEDYRYDEDGSSILEIKEILDKVEENK